MDKKILYNLTLLIILIGFAFSGWLTYGSLTGPCPIDGACLGIFGYPACMYGFIIYLILLVLFLATWKKKLNESAGLKSVAVVSFIGILFAGWLMAEELALGRPTSTCAMGFVMYLLVFLLTLVNISKKQAANKQ